MTNEPRPDSNPLDSEFALVLHEYESRDAGFKRVAWLTDIHLNFLRTEQTSRFLNRVAASAPGALLVGGDIGEAPSVAHYLEQVSAVVECPVYFVLGNHDFYFGSIRDVRFEVSALCRANRRLTWLTEGSVVELTPFTGLVGHDGWADARLGDYEHSYVMMNDYKLIAELGAVDKRRRWSLLNALGDEAADAIRQALFEALPRFFHVIVLTHVPPFQEACWYQGQISNNEWLPHFTCHAVGEVLLQMAAAFPDRHLTVLCGHTHSFGECRPRENLRVITGGALYRAPAIQRMFVLG